MSKIILDENYSIESDTYCWILRYEKEKEGFDKDGNPKTIVSKNETYHASINDALKKYTDNSVKKSNSLKEISDLIDAILNKLDLLKFENEPK